jgi:hypothetical protein
MGDSMGNVKSALEIALEKAGKIGGLSQDEKERLQDQEEAASILKDFHLGRLDSNSLWKQLRGRKPSFLSLVQMNFIDTLSLASSEEDIQKRKEGIVAVETLKDNQNTAEIEMILNAIQDLQRDYQAMKEQAVADLRRQMEQNPQLRMQPVKTPDGRTVMKMSVSVDEAVKSRISEFLQGHEEQYNGEFLRLIHALKKSSG